MTNVPAIFVGHGSPMHGLGDSTDTYIQAWKNIATSFPRPKCILAISAHWYTLDTRVTANKSPKTIHDFYNFPRALHEVEYPAPGYPKLAEKVSKIIDSVAPEASAKLDSSTWGLDHGVWAVLRHMYPEADIPVIQLSINKSQPMEFHYKLGRALAQLREEGVLILGSGNLVHNFDYLDFTSSVTPNWANEFKDWCKQISQDESIDRNNASEFPLVKWQSHPYAKKAQSSPDHFIPALYVLGTAKNHEKVTWPLDNFEFGTLSMAAFVVG